MFPARLFIGLCLLGWVARAAGEADAEWQALEAVAREEPLIEIAAQPAARILWRDERNQRLAKQALAWYEAHPSDPRRWEAVMYMIDNPPSFITTPRETALAISDAMPRLQTRLQHDQAAQAAARAKLSELEKAMNEASDVPEAVRLRRSVKEIELAMFMQAESADGRAAILTLIERHQARFPDAAGIESLFREFLALVEGVASGEVDGVRKRLAANPSFTVRQLAESKWQNSSVSATTAAAIASARAARGETPEADVIAFRRDSVDAWRKVMKGESVEWESLLERMAALAMKYPKDNDMGDSIARGVMYCYELSHTPAESGVVWKRLIGSPNATVAGIAREKSRVMERLQLPIELAFTALDGREVDLVKLRGQVVLLDFWATWCVPCMQEMPNVKRIYSVYHDRGFEVIGVSCDFSPQAPGVAYVTSTAGKTGPEVLAFVKKNMMPWPQHYEGRKHNEGGNTVAARFAVTGIPAAFLIDKNGRVVGTNVRGEKLEAEVKRLLAEPWQPEKTGKPKAKSVWGE